MSAPTRKVIVTGDKCPQAPGATSAVATQPEAPKAFTHENDEMRTVRSGFLLDIRDAFDSLEASAGTLSETGLKSDNRASLMIQPALRAIQRALWKMDVNGVEAPEGEDEEGGDHGKA